MGWVAQEVAKRSQGAPVRPGVSGSSSSGPVSVPGSLASVPELEMAAVGGYEQSSNEICITVPVNLDGREVARNQVRYIPDAVRRYGVR